MPERPLRTAREVGRASDADLVSGVVERDEHALRELSRRHGAALSVLACAIVRQPAWATRAVADVFASVWADPDQLGGSAASVRAQLAALVHERCRTMELQRVPRPAGVVPSWEATRRRTEVSPDRIAVALIAFGDHTCWEAAERVGTDAAVVAERLRTFVLDPERFSAYLVRADNVVALHDARTRRYSR